VTVWLTVLIAAMSTLAAGTIGAVAALHAAERSRQEARRSDTLAALAEYFAAASTVVGELSRLPAVPRTTLVNKLAERALVPWYGGRAGAELETLRRVRKYVGDRPSETIERLLYAAARVRVVLADARFDALAERIFEYVVELGEDRTPEKLEKWRPLREELLAFIAQLRGELDERKAILRWI